VFRSLIAVFEKEDYALKRALSPSFCLLVSADCPVVDPQFRRRLAGSKFEIADYVIVFRRRWIIRRAQWANDHEQIEE
jgi:hypothetical protein